MYTGKLPDEFGWRFAPGSSADNVCLDYSGEETAVVRRMGQGWLAVIRHPFQSAGYDACIVSSLSRGQVWLAQRARCNLVSIRAASAARRCDALQARLCNDLTPLCSPL